MLPAKSPDVNIIEKIWAIMKDDVSRAEPKNEKQLKIAMLEAWKKISKELVQQLIARIPWVLDKIVLNGGSVVD